MFTAVGQVLLIAAVVLSPLALFVLAMWLFAKAAEYLLYRAFSWVNPVSEISSEERPVAERYRQPNVTPYDQAIAAAASRPGAYAALVRVYAAF